MMIVGNFNDSDEEGICWVEGRQELTLSRGSKKVMKDLFSFFSYGFIIILQKQNSLYQSIGLMFEVKILG